MARGEIEALRANVEGRIQGSLRGVGPTGPEAGARSSKNRENREYSDSRAVPMKV